MQGSQPPEKKGPQNGSSRRDFLRGSGIAAATAVITGPAVAALDEARADAIAKADGAALLTGDVKIALKVNGQNRPVTVEPRSTLLDVLRNRLDVTGPKRVCDRASCGACTTIVDGKSVYACTTLAITCQGKTIQTLESFDTGPDGVPQAFVNHDGLMCGYCTPGFVTSCKALLDQNPNPTPDEIRKGLDGNICRCGTYVGVMNAAMALAKAQRA